MAVAANEIARFRGQATSVITGLRNIEETLATIEDFGADDAARAAFFQDSFGPTTDNPDLTWAEFVAAMLALRAMRTAWNTNKLALVKVLR